jgi:hypothetical protein
MNQDSFNRVWNSPSVSRVVDTTASMRPELPRLDIQPLGIAIRLDTVIPTRMSEGAPASRLIWMSPGRQGRPVETLKALILTN